MNRFSWLCGIVSLLLISLLLGCTDPYGGLPRGVYELPESENQQPLDVDEGGVEIISYQFISKIPISYQFIS